MFTIKLMASANGEKTPHDGRYLVEYLPAPMGADGRYLPGGVLITSADIGQAQHFETAADAFTVWRQSNGLRPDGKPNRPLTAWHAEITAMACV